jgi:hypothetical protein
MQHLMVVLHGREGVGLVASGVRAAFMLDYASPEAAELAAFLRAARVRASFPTLVLLTSR